MTHIRPYIHSAFPFQFTERNVQLLQIVAKQAGTMMSNRERYEESIQSSLQQVINVTESVMWWVRNSQSRDSHTTRRLEVQPNMNLLVNHTVESAMIIYWLDLPWVGST